VILSVILVIGFLADKGERIFLVISFNKYPDSKALAAERPLVLVASTSSRL
jgi:hypothetical protein